MRLERVVSLTLRIGVITASVLVVVGLILYFAEGDMSSLVSSNFNVGQVLAGLARADPLSIIFLGVIVLIATPLLRVLELALDYAWERDRIYVLLSLIVLVLMVVGIVLLPLEVP